MRNMIMNRFWRMAALLIVLAMLAAIPSAYSMAEDEEEPITYAEPHHIIIDTDTAGDDALAMILAGIAENIKIEGVTVLAGNVNIDQAVQNALMTLEVIDRTDVPVYKGASTTYNGVERTCFSVFGSDGMGDADLIHPTGKAQEQPAVDFIIDAVKKYPEEIEIVMIGPATNIALAMEKDPETMSHVKRIWSMGTSGFGEGNATPVAEFNVYHDAEAYDIVLRSGVPMTIIGLDMCETETMLCTPEEMEVLAQNSATGRFITTSWRKLLEFREEKNSQYNVDLCDAVAMSCLIIDGIMQEIRQCAAVCMTKDDETHGQVIFYRKDKGYDSMPQISEEDYNITVVNKMDESKYSQMKVLLESFKEDTTDQTA